MKSFKVKNEFKRYKVSENAEFSAQVQHAFKFYGEMWNKLS